MLTIRLARTGRSKYPTYRIVAAESARAATGKFVAILGHYNPHTKQLVIKQEEIKKHLSNGAQPSNTVARLLTREKVELPSWVSIKTKAPKSKTGDGEPKTEEAPKAEAKADEAPKAEADTAAVAEAPALENAGQRVAETAEAEASQAEDKATPIDRTDTAPAE